jgi:hypothetical protein
MRARCPETNSLPTFPPQRPEAADEAPCASSAPLRLVSVSSELQFSPQFTSGWIRRRAQIVPEPSVEDALLLLTE